MGPEKTEELLKGWTPMSCKGQFQLIKAWLKNQIMLSEDQKKKLAKERKTAQWKLLETPQAKIRSTSAKQAQENPKEQPEGQSKSKGKGKAQVEQALPTELQDSQEREDSHDNVFSMARTLMELKKKEEEILSQSFPKK
ncbi:hypothetical protein O181_121381 [Austropuccinia psidii MF-1]|uniref:Uncharacterized protein n=1 Tax=Austropuccinia psidii MF-1 TaxID=1389203 RepID=A0A9Q3KKB1_9BASI|nr:hypothetical protein [Austropuccinia psidii MF-1]